ncbi:PHF20 protein, partial [Amia calva]|nr:PHF20 protein [Amia calva]
MSKTPPNRRGITFKVGAQLEARDSLKNWYAANIEKIDYEDEKVLIHYRQWSHRYDEWFDWASPYLRPVERIQLRREGLQEEEVQPGFRVNEKVLASWSDCRFYPAKVLAVNKDASYTVKFFDGVIQTVKGIHVKPFYKEKSGGKSKKEDKNREKYCFKKERISRDVSVEENGKDTREEKENGTMKSKKIKRSAKELGRDTDRERPEEHSDHKEESKKPKRGFPAQDDRKSQGTKGADEKQVIEKCKKNEPNPVIPAEKDGERDGSEWGEPLQCDPMEQSRDTGEEVELEIDDTERQSERREEMERSQDKKVRAGAEDKLEAELGGPGEEEEGAEQAAVKEGAEKDCKISEAGETTKEPPAGTQPGGRESEAEEQTPTPVRRKRGRPSSASKSPDNQRGVLELRKRKISLGLNLPSKRTRLDTNPDNSNPSEPKPATEASTPNQNQEAADAIPESLAISSTNPELQEGGDGQAETTMTPAEPGSISAEQAPVVKRQPHPPNPNKFSREPLYTAIKQSPTALAIDLDHNTFKCKVPDCLKSFRKAKLLHYHMKYYHGVDKTSEGEQSPKRSIQTRASEKQAALENPKRRRTISASLHLPLHSTHRTLQSPRSDGKAGRLNEKRRTSAPPAVNTLNNHRPSLREKSKENQIEKSNRKQQQQQQQQEKEKTSVETVVKDKEKLKEKKHRDFLRIKLKKKKKKKKKSKSEYTGSEENIDISRDFSSKKLFVQSKLNLAHKFSFSHKHKLLHNSSPGHNTETLKLDADEDTLSDSSTDSLLWSEDEYGQDVDVTTNPEEEGPVLRQREFEIVRCVCEVQEENDFMIQCEECLCWQHGICMGLLEDNVPEKYSCYICRDPPGQRQSLKYWYDKDWLSSGHMYGLSFLEENYSHQNAKKIAATHQLLGDVHRVIEVLNGLQLKMSILQSQAHPDLKLWCQPWKQVDSWEKPWKKGAGTGVAAAAMVAADDGEEREKSSVCRAVEAVVEKPCRIPSFQHSYITSEHCYQKPRTYYPAVEQRLVVETRGTDLEDSLRSTEDLLALGQRYGRSLDSDRVRTHSQLQLDKNTHSKEAEVPKKGSLEKGTEAKAEPGAESTDSFQQQWQINLLDHIEAVQDEVIHRMDFIERELDVLESWLDYTGELEPPEPLARLPQLKHRIKQLLTELGKVQQIALCCST